MEANAQVVKQEVVEKSGSSDDSARRDTPTQDFRCSSRIEEEQEPVHLSLIHI